MKISELLKSGECTLSMEVFPPKTSSKYESVEASVKEIAKLNPAWISVTYGAGGGTSDYTVQISKMIKDTGVTSLAHLSCISSDRETVHKQLDQLKEMGIENILALRGDMLEGMDTDDLTYHYASDLIKEIHEYGDFCVGAACYPEGHPEAADWKSDMENLKKKVDAGVDFLTTQMFFDNSMFYSFLYRAREAGINVPIVAGIMPITTEKQVSRAMKLSGCMMPARFRALVDHFGSDPEAMKKAGIIYATDQIIDLLANGVKNIHVYTMNKPDVAEAIYNNLKGLM
ncbi:MAG: methylenetetrahydrofolate reductase [NAD(P)H] [Erysipelotrichaceae bacterium]|nr:methylenetetrahydrofolate reductase [NAD(P)H] [Erysipelotrichaceae bacterium]